MVAGKCPLRNKWTLNWVERHEVGLLDSDTAIAARFEDRVEVNALRLGLAKGGILLRRYIGVVVDVSVFSELEFQQTLRGNITHAGNDAGIDRLSPHLYLPGSAASYL